MLFDTPTQTAGSPDEATGYDLLEVVKMGESNATR